ncbi:MAG: uroporphyrinogen decarboxylase family protein [Candidatus Latescibacterota bacterium]|jgi:hypothetical protein
MRDRRGKGDLLRAALERRNAQGPVPYGEMHVDQGFIQKFYGRPRQAFGYRDEIEFSLQVGRALIKPFWYGSIFTTPEGGPVDSIGKVEGMVVRGGLAMEGVPLAEAREMGQAIADCERVGLLPGVQLGGTLCYCWRTTGFETFMMALHTDRALAELILERTVERQRRCAEAIADCGFEVVMFSDDISGNGGLFISPALFREVIIPGYRRILEPLVQAGIKVIFHSDGIVTPVLDDIITCGIAAYQSIEYGLNDLRQIIARYGDRLSLWGNVNCDVLHAGPVKLLPGLVRECLDAAAGFPGFVIGTDNSVFEDVPVEHFLAYHRALADAGVAVERLVS